jgi:hypothetical protein
MLYFNCGNPAYTLRSPLCLISARGGGGVYIQRGENCTELWFVTNAFLCVVHFRTMFSHFCIIFHYFLQPCCYFSMRYPLTHSGNYHLLYQLTLRTQRLLYAQPGLSLNSTFFAKSLRVFMYFVLISEKNQH